MTKHLKLLRKRLQVRCLRQQSGSFQCYVNVSGDITLMDASDAADYVQELAGESASIIFGAMYDDTKSDECTITVIATGLHNVGGSASKLKQGWKDSRKKWDPFFRPGIHRLEAIFDSEGRTSSAGRREVQCLHFSRELRQAR